MPSPRIRTIDSRWLRSALALIALVALAVTVPGTEGCGPGARHDAQLSLRFGHPVCR